MIAAFVRQLDRVAPSRSRALSTPAPQRTPADARCAWVVASVGLTLFSAYLYRPLVPGSALATDEHVWPYLRARQYLLELGAAHWPQTFPEAFRGGGYAFPYFYPPLSQYVAALGAALTDNVVYGVHLAFVLSIWLSGLAMLWAVRRLGGSAAAGVLGAVLYVSFPYRWIDVFGRGALAESWTFAWYPIIVAGAWTVWRGSQVRWWLPVTIAALLLTHPVMALYFAGALASVLLCCWHDRSRAGPRQLVLASFVGIALAAWYLVPSQADLPLIRAHDPAIMGALPSRVGQIGIATAQVLGLTGLALGYGPNISAVQLALPFLVIAPRFTGRRGPHSHLGVACILAWLLLATLVVEPAPFYAVLPAKLAYIQFPWRGLGLIALLASLAFALLADGLHSAVLVGLAVGVALGAVLLPVSTPTRWPHMTHDAILALPAAVGDSGYTVQGEYLPRTADHRTLARAIAAGPEVSSGVEVTRWSNGVRPSIDVQSRGTAEVILPVVAYPFYRVMIDGLPVPARDSAGRLAVKVPVGEHRIVVEQTLTTAQYIGVVVTFCALLGLTLFHNTPRREGPTAECGAT